MKKYHLTHYLPLLWNWWKSRLYNQFTWCKNRKEGRNSQISEYGKCTCIFEEYRFSMSKSKLYKLTALKSIPVHKNGNNLLFLQKELEQWFESQIHTDNDKIESITNSCLYGGIKNNRKNGRK